MLFKDISFQTPEENILFDEALLESRERNNDEDVLRLWESKETFVVLGRISQIKDDLNLDNIKKDKISVLRRISGGGTVLQGKGCLNYSLVLSKARNPHICEIKKSYNCILGKVVDVLNILGINAVFYPISDIATAENQKKVSGNAQKRTKNFILHHGTLLYDFDIRKVNVYLKMPAEKPNYRGNRSHDDFLTNIYKDPAEIREAFMKIFQINKKDNNADEKEMEILQGLLRKRNVVEQLV